MKIKRLICLILALIAVCSMFGFTYGDEYGYGLYYNFDGTDVIGSPAEMDAFMEQFMFSGQSRVTFTVTYPADLNMTAFSNRYALPSIEANFTTSGSNTVVNMTVQHFPGNKVVHAYRSGDTSLLNGEELAVYNWSVDFLANNITPDMDAVQIESTIQDALIQRITYYTTYTAPNAPVQRFQTAIGAIVDCQANCMGYADAFMMLGNMAGLEVYKQTGYCNGDRHIWNIVHMENGWYAMDVTNNDLGAEYGSGMLFFNAGSNTLYANGYYWDAGTVLHTIVP